MDEGPLPERPAATPPRRADPRDDVLGEDDDRQLVLGDLLNHVLDKGVVLTGDVMISIADIDLVRVGLSLLITGVDALDRRVEELEERVRARREPGRSPVEPGADVPLLPPDAAR